MKTKMELTAEDLFNSGYYNISSLDNTDLKDFLKSYFIDNSYTIYEIIECLKNGYDDTIVKSFELEEKINLAQDNLKKLFPRSYSKNECMNCATQLFIKYLLNWGRDLKNLFTSSFWNDFEMSIESAFDSIIYGFYGTINYKNYEDSEYNCYVRTHRMFG